jgi:hypothetical protein
VGGQRILQSDVRVIAATNRDLEAAIRAGRFREDLYYRLNVIAIRVPPLRDRPGEIAVLADHFLCRFNAEYGRSVAMSAATLRMFMDYAWPGNVRELENTVRRMVVLGSALARVGAVTDPGAGITAPAPAMAPVSVPPPGPTSLKAIAREAARDAEVVLIRAVGGHRAVRRLRPGRSVRRRGPRGIDHVLECRFDGDPAHHPVATFAIEHDQETECGLAIGCMDHQGSTRSVALDKPLQLPKFRRRP